MPQERLSMVSIELARRLAASGDDRVLRNVAHLAAALAEDRVHLDDPRVRAAMLVLEEGSCNEALRAELDALAEELDEAYWDLQDAHEDGRVTEEAYLAAFAQARAVSAVAWALHPDPTLAASEAAYEAHCAFSDGSEVVPSALRLLDREGA